MKNFKCKVCGEEFTLAIDASQHRFKKPSHYLDEESIQRLDLRLMQEIMCRRRPWAIVDAVEGALDRGVTAEAIVDAIRPLTAAEPESL